MQKGRSEMRGLISHFDYFKSFNDFFKDGEYPERRRGEESCDPQLWSWGQRRHPELGLRWSGAPDIGEMSSEQSLMIFHGNKLFLCRFV